MQKPLGGQGFQGELTELSVTGGQALAAVVAADRLAPLALFCWSDWKSVAVARQIAIAAVGSALALLPRGDVADEAVRPESPPVSSTFTVPSSTPPVTRLKVNFGQTFSVESNVLEFIVIVPVELLKTDRPT